MKIITVLMMALVFLAASGTSVKAQGGIDPGGIGGGTVIVKTCSPVSSMTVKGNATAGELGVGSVQIGWSVKPCDKTQAVRVVAELANWSTKEVVYSNPDAGLDGKITVYVASGKYYEARILVYSATTGELLGSKVLGASTVGKGV